MDREANLSMLRPLAAVTGALLLVTAVVYPLLITGVGQLVFNHQANGSMISVDGREVGSSLVGQAFAGDQYFHGRPSAAGAGYDGASSSGSNLGPSSAKLLEGIHDPANPAGDFDGVRDRVATFREANGLQRDTLLPSDSVTASASGLDPHISPATARLQVSRIAGARAVSESDVLALLDEYHEERWWGLIGEPRVNVLKLNVALDERFPRRP